tara:strand:- start:603 stop:1124 length:522 start_codon:yes stop_codon:yes gene_type:complete
MIINKYFNKKVAKNYFFVEGTLDIDCEYFIKKINQGVQEKDNMNFRTNIKGEMTSFKYFINDFEFHKIYFQLIDYLEIDQNLSNHKLEDAWGLKCDIGSKTLNHDHDGNIISGVIYFNTHPQLLEFNEINQTVKPEPGKFVIFSPFLKHECKRSMSNETKYGLSFNSGPVLFT